MNNIIESDLIKGVYTFDVNVYNDSRGCFYESYNLDKFSKLPISSTFIQDNVSLSSKNVIRGLHYQYCEHAQAKLIHVVQGHIIDVIVDMRTDSPTFGQYETFELNSYETIDNRKFIYIPRGMAHGFITLKDTVFSYKVDRRYAPESQRCLKYNDKTINIPWSKLSGINENDFIISEKDQAGNTFNELREELIILSLKY